MAWRSSSAILTSSRITTTAWGTPPATPPCGPRRASSRAARAAPTWSRRLPPASPTVHEVDHVAVLDDVLLALGAEQRLLAGGVERTQLDEVVDAHDLGAHEAVLDVAVDAARGLLGRAAAGQLPGARLAAAEVAGEERDVAEHLVGRAQEHVDGPRLVGAELGAELGGVFGLEIGELGFEARGDGDHLVAPAASPLDERGVGGERLRRAHVVVGVEDEEDGPVADQRQLAEQGRVFGLALHAARQPALPEGGEQVFERRQLALGRLVAAARRLARLVDAALDELQVAEDELRLDELHVGPGVDGLAHVGDLRVGEHADHVREGVDAAYVGEEAVA